MELKKSIIGEILESISPAEARRIETRMLLAAKIDDAMKANGWKKKDLMLAMGKTNQSEITRWLSGTHNFTSDLLSDLGRVLNTNFFNLEPTLPQSVVFQVVTVSTPVSSTQNCNVNDLLKGQKYYNKTVSTQNQLNIWTKIFHLVSMASNYSNTQSFLPIK